MSTLKERFEHYTQKPDEKVWQSINQSLNRRIVRRRVVTAASVSAVAAGIALALLINRQNETIPSSAQMPQLASIAEQQGISFTNTDNVSVSQSDIEQPRQTSSTVRQEQDQMSLPLLAQDDRTVIPATVETTMTNEDVLDAIQPLVTVQPAEVSESKINPVNSNSTTETAVVIEEQQNEQNRETATIQSSKIKASNDSLVVYVPNAFSPNDYGAENPDVRVFKVYPNSSASILSYKIYIYSRTGRLVYQSTDINGAWDGRARGVDQPMGVYTYILEVNDAVRGLQHKKGTVTLIR